MPTRMRQRSGCRSCWSSSLALGVARRIVYLRRSLPTVTAAVSVAGIGAPVEIIRDADNIPHIFAGSKADAFYGLGYAHAQDRLWQMEFQRRIGHGRLSEMFGAATLPQDRFLRTAGFGRAARARVGSPARDARPLIDAYVAGVNAFLEATAAAAAGVHAAPVRARAMDRARRARVGRR